MHEISVWQIVAYEINTTNVKVMYYGICLSDFNTISFIDIHYKYQMTTNHLSHYSV